MEHPAIAIAVVFGKGSRDMVRGGSDGRYVAMESRAAVSRTAMRLCKTGFAHELADRRR
jgi:hypothetical protein